MSYWSSKSIIKPGKIEYFLKNQLKSLAHKNSDHAVNEIERLQIEYQKIKTLEDHDQELKRSIFASHSDKETEYYLNITH